MTRVLARRASEANSSAVLASVQEDVVPIFTSAKGLSSAIFAIEASPTLLPIASDFTHFGNFGGMGNKGERDGFSVSQVRGCSVLMRLRSNDLGSDKIDTVHVTPYILSRSHGDAVTIAVV